MWDKVSLAQYKELQEINTMPLSEVDKTLYSACIVYGLTEWQLDNMKPKKAARKIVAMSNGLSCLPKFTAAKRIGKYFIDYSIENMRFGQYVELAYFMQRPPLEVAHYVLASTSHLPLSKNDSDDHSEKSAYFIKQPIEKVLGSVMQLITNFNTFNKRYKGLFGLSDEKQEYDLTEVMEARKTEQDPFNLQYGWIYSATLIAEHERIVLDKAYLLPVKQALHDLSYLKALGKYNERQLKNK